MRPDKKGEVLRAALEGTLNVRTDFTASPTGFPFKVAEIPGTVSEDIIYKTRNRVCNECALRSPYRTESGVIGYRCSSEPVADYVIK